MEFLGIGPLELIFIVLIALVLLGPEDMLKATRNLGKFLRNLFTSPLWGEFQRSFHSLRNLPYSVAREAGIEDEMRSITSAVKMDVPSIRIAPTDFPQTVKSIEEASTAAAQSPESPGIILDTPVEPLTATNSEDERITEADQERPPQNLPDQEQQI